MESRQERIFSDGVDGQFGVSELRKFCLSGDTYLKALELRKCVKFSVVFYSDWIKLINSGPEQYVGELNCQPGSGYH